MELEVEIGGEARPLSRKKWVSCFLSAAGCALRKQALGGDRSRTVHSAPRSKSRGKREVGSAKREAEQGCGLLEGLHYHGETRSMQEFRKYTLLFPFPKQ